VLSQALAHPSLGSTVRQDALRESQTRVPYRVHHNEDSGEALRREFLSAGPNRGRCACPLSF
jgi:hypothetical protein